MAFVKAFLFCFGATASPMPGGRRITIAPGVEMPVMNNGKQAAPPNSTNAVETWLRVGGRGLDTAWSYFTQDQYGEGIRKSGVPRNEIFLTTKIPCVGSTEIALELVKDDIKKLGTYADLVIIHGTGAVKPVCYGNPGTAFCSMTPQKKCCQSMADIQATYRGLELALQQNLTRAIGISNFQSEHLDALLETAKVTPAVNQAELYVGHHDDRFMQKCKQHGITWMAYSPLGPNNVYPKSVLEEPNTQRIAKAHNVSTASLGLAWVVQQDAPAVTSTGSEDHALEDLAVEKTKLSKEEMDELNSVSCIINFNGTQQSVTCKKGEQVMQCSREEQQAIVV